MWHRLVKESLNFLCIEEVGAVGTIGVDHIMYANLPRSKWNDSEANGLSYHFGAGYI